MAADDTLQGHRADDVQAVWDGEPGGYYLDDARRVLWAKAPVGESLRLPVQEGAAHPSEVVWGFTEHDDGTITVAPSINLHASENVQGWHGFLEHGVWRTV